MKKLNELKKNEKGFTLVELIVVLVILAILATLLVPALTGYIDKAREKSLTAECRSSVVAAQTIASELYGTTGVDDDKIGTDAVIAQIKELAEVEGGISGITVNAKGKITKLVYTAKSGTKTCTYTYTAGTGASYTIS